MSVPVKLNNPIPYEAAMQMVRHLKRINTALGFYYTVTDANVSNQPQSFENANIGQNKGLFLNVNWDIDECLDVQPDTRTQGITNYRSTVFLNAYLFDNVNPHLARTRLHADLHRYFFNKPQTPNYDKAVGDNNWTLYNELGQAVVHELYITRLNTTLTLEKKPMIQVDFELAVYWAAINSDLSYPR